MTWELSVVDEGEGVSVLQINLRARSILATLERRRDLLELERRRALPEVERKWVGRGVVGVVGSERGVV